MNALSIRFGEDEIGPITDRLCDVCDEYVYENLGEDIYGPMTVWVYLCLKCDERMMAFMCSSAKTRRQRVAFLEGLQTNRFKAIATLGFKKAKEREEQEQLSLWD